MTSTESPRSKTTVTRNNSKACLTFFEKSYWWFWGNFCLTKKSNFLEGLIPVKSGVKRTAFHLKTNIPASELWCLNALQRVLIKTILPRRFLHGDVKDSQSVIPNSWLQFLLPIVAQAVIRRRGHFTFTQGQVGLDNFCSLNKWNHHLKTKCYIYSGCLCLLLKFVLWVKAGSMVVSIVAVQQEGNEFNAPQCVWVVVSVC